MMGPYGGGMGMFGWLVMGGFWLLLLGLIVWLVACLLPGSGSGSGSGDEPTRARGESALDILDRRMANGEIDMQTWQSQRGALLAALRSRG